MSTFFIIFAVLAAVYGFAAVVMYYGFSRQMPV